MVEKSTRSARPVDLPRGEVAAAAVDVGGNDKGR